MNPLEAFPGGADEARKFIHYMRDDEPKLSVRSQAVCDLALLGLDSLAADPEREAKVEAEALRRAVVALVAARGTCTEGYSVTLLKDSAGYFMVNVDRGVVSIVEPDAATEPGAREGE